MAQEPPFLCRLNEWASLRTHLNFVYDGRVPYGDGRGSYERTRGEVSAWLVRQGHVDVEAGGRKLTARAGQWLVCAAPRLEQELSAGAELLSLRFHHHWPDGESPFTPDVFCVFDAEENGELEKIALDITNADNGRSRESGYAFMWMSRVDHPTYVHQQGLLMLLIAELSRILAREGFKPRVQAIKDSRMAQALRIVDAGELDQSFPAARIAAACGLTLRRLDTICEKSYGFTLHQYWEQRRLDCARRSLEQGGVEIKPLALNLGFSQLSYFSAWFKRHTGLSPRLYRSRNQQGV